MPFITEALWHPVAKRLGIEGETIMLQPYPGEQNAAIDANAEADFDWMRDIVSFVRTMRSDRGLPPGGSVPLILQGSDKAVAEAKEKLFQTESMIRHLGRVESVGFLSEGERAPPSAFELLGDLKLLVPLEGVMDLAVERARLDKAITKTQGELARVAAKLDNPNFRDRAPKQVVASELEKRQGLDSRLARLKAERASLQD